LCAQKEAAVETLTIDVRSVDLATLRGLPRDELTEALYSLDAADLALLFTRLGDEAVAELLAELDSYDAARLIGKLSRLQAAEVLEEMDPDDAADVVDEMEPVEAEAILVAMKPDEANDLRELLSYPAESAGGLMTPEYVALTPTMRADEALTALRRAAEEAETIYYTYVVEPDTRKLLGVLSLRNLVLSRPWVPVSDLMVQNVQRVRVDADQEEAARLLDQYSLIALPVVDEDDRLLGIITADDAADVLLEEAEEDIQRLGGSQPLEEPYLRASITHLFRKRAPWLLFLFIGQAYTSSVLAAFEVTFSELAVLVIFIPMLIGIGGNVGSQTVTTLVRAMGTGEVDLGDVFRVLRREITVGVMLGALMGVASYIRAFTMGEAFTVGPAVATAAVCIVIWAATVAALLPLALRKLRVDPAVVSAPFITTLVDGTGLFIYFTIAKILLGLD
jgi:magnesium transporter